MTRSILSTGLAALLLPSALAVPALAHEPQADDARGQELFQPGLGAAAALAEGVSEELPPLYEGLGAMTLPITTRSEQAQAYFDQGWRLTWAFNHAEAVRAFRAAQAADPDCALCYWGEAFALGPNLNDGMPDAAIAPALAAIRQAQTLVDRAGTDKERALIAALAERYGDDTANRAALDQAWADAMAKVAERYPDDAHVLTLYADALMNLQPWDYWEAGGETPRGHGGTIVEVLERAIAVDPDHPGAAHLYIHAVEASAEPERAEAIADRLRGAMPGAGHLTHMPAHIYTRVGRFADSITVNRDAIAADEAFLAEADGAVSSLYRYGYYPHNVHFLMTSAQMAGVEEDVFFAAEKLADVTSEAVAGNVAWVQAILAAPYSAHAQFSDPATILVLPEPDDAFPFVQGFWHYARGVAFAWTGEYDDAWDEVGAIEELIATADLSDLEAQYLPARDVLGIAKHTVEARIEQARGDYEAAEHLLREAIGLQDTLPYMEPPYWYYPVRQTLGAVLLQQDKPQEAIAAFEQALEELPRNGWALWGLWQAREASGDHLANEAKAAFEEAWLGDTAVLTPNRL